ncbi:hypothetical protein [Prosthecobacter sp.]|uniref:hypothetical protein n=1 Tax=Prosthecobacter sp. TaxID=1965333 RepID=UPI0037C54DA8
MRSVRLLVLSFLIAPMALADTRVFVSLAGSLMEAEITAVSGDNVTLKRSSDQQTLTINRKTLCKEDSTYIATWAAQHPDLATAPAPTAAGTSAPVQKYRLVCQTLPAKSNRGPPDSDHRVFEYTYNFNLSNQEVGRDLQNARGLAFTLGKNVLDPNGDLIVLQKEEFDINIRPQSKMVHTTQPVRLTYSQDPDYPYGVKSYGYVLIVRDAAGNVLLVEASPDASAKFTKEILALPDAPCMVDRDFKLKSKTDVPLGYISF